MDQEHEDYDDPDLTRSPGCFEDPDRSPVSNWVEEMSPIIVVFASFGTLVGAMVIISLLAGGGSR